MPSLRQHLARIKQEYTASITHPLNVAEELERQRLMSIEPTKLLEIAVNAPSDSVFERKCISIVRNTSRRCYVSPYPSAMQVIEAALMEMKDKLVDSDVLTMFIPSRGYILAFNLVAQYYEKKTTEEWIYSAVEKRHLFILSYLFITKVVSGLPNTTIHAHNWNLYKIIWHITHDSGCEWLARILTGELIPDYSKFLELVPMGPSGCFQSAIYKETFEQLELATQCENAAVAPTSEEDEADGQQDICFPSEKNYWLDIWRSWKVPKHPLWNP